MRRTLVHLALAALPLALCADVDSPYGICMHGMAATNRADRFFRYLNEGGIDWARHDFNWEWMERKPGVIDFGRYPEAVAEGLRRRIITLPILHHAPQWCQPVEEHQDEWAEYVRKFVTTFSSMTPVIEVWNEPNGCGRVHNPTNYALCLKTAYREIKKLSPATKVTCCGFAGLPEDYIRELYRNGIADSFDIFNFHHYEFPRDPESELTRVVDRARALMAEHGDREKPIWVTETGYPTQKESFGVRGLLKCGLQKALRGRPLSRLAHVVLDSLNRTGFDREGMDYQRSISNLLRSELPDSANPQIEFVSGDDLDGYLRRSRPDVLVLPFMERYPVKSVSALAEYVDQGGILVADGGIPIYTPVSRSTNSGFTMADGSSSHRDRVRLHVKTLVPWDRKGIPEQIRMFPTDNAKGVPDKKKGYSYCRYLLPNGDTGEESFVPLMTSTNDYEGVGRLVGAAVYMRKSGGAVIANTFWENKEDLWTSDHARQAEMVPRTYFTLLAAGVEKVFWFTLRTSETDPYDRESWFGIVNPKTGEAYPALQAYRTMTLQRPVGSKGPTRGETWCDWRTGVFHPAWVRPDGRHGGALWAPEGRIVYCRFASDDVEFCDLFGQKTKMVTRTGDGKFLIRLRGSVIYYSGSELICVQSK